MRYIPSLLLVALLSHPLANAQGGGASGSGAAGGGSNSSANTSSDGPFQISGEEMAQRITHRGHAVYPQDAQNTHTNDTVVVNAIISKDGTVKSVAVSSGPDMLSSAAIDAAQQYTFRPYLKDGKPVEVDTTIAIHFSHSTPASPQDGHPAESSTGIAQSPAIDALTNNSTNKAPAGTPNQIALDQEASSGQESDEISCAKAEQNQDNSHILKMVPPKFPFWARVDSTSGLVIVRANVAKDGHVVSATAIKGPDALRPSAVTAVKQWRYKPFLKDGVAVEQDVRVCVNYRIRHKGDTN